MQSACTAAILSVTLRTISEDFMDVTMTKNNDPDTLLLDVTVLESADAILDCCTTLRTSLIDGEHLNLPRLSRVQFVARSRGEDH